MKKASTLVLAGMALAATTWWTAPDSDGTPEAEGAALAQGTARDEAAIRRAFQSVLNRDPSPRERRRYGVLMERYEWTEADVRHDLQERTDYRRYARGRGTAPDASIRQAYQDILAREPDAEGLQHYRRRIFDEGWTIQDVREALRESPEFNSQARRNASAERIVRRAYQDVLRREPDAEGLANYRRLVVDEGWEEHDVRRALRRSPERQERRQAMSDARATEIVRRAYLQVLRREPDEKGLQDYKARVRQDGWTERQVIDALRDSPEYRSKNR